MSTSIAPPQMTARTGTKSQLLRWICFGVGVCVCIFVVVLALKWPFTRAAMIQRLEQASSAKVEIHGFRSTFFPYPGCIAENVVFLQNGSPSRAGQQVIPVITIRKLTIESTLAGLLSKPSRIKKIIADDLRVHIPAGGANLHQAANSKGGQTVIEEISAENALLEIATGGSENRPLVFQVHKILFRNIGDHNRVPYQVSLRLPIFPGEVESSGWLGPWKDDNGMVRSTAVSGTYSLQQGDLSVFKSLGGIVSSRGEFSGTLDRLSVAGNTDTPQFEVIESGHRFHVATQFRGSVDLKTGDVTLPILKARLGDTDLTADAAVTGYPKTVALNVTEGRGQIQDLILLFSNARRSPVTGPIAFQTKISLPPEHRPFKERVQLTGTFNSDPVKFTSSNTQKDIDQLSERAKGKKDKQKDFDEDDDKDGFARVLTKLTGQVRMADGVATFSRISFSVPGAHGDMNGIYNLVNKRVNLHGKMSMEATVSQATTGKKSFFLKVLDPFFKKKHAGAQVPITMTGLYGDTHFSAGLK
jgi:hypothetical protein